VRWLGKLRHLQTLYFSLSPSWIWSPTALFMFNFETVWNCWNTWRKWDAGSGEHASNFLHIF